jgi:hypothetical protein
VDSSQRNMMATPPSRPLDKGAFGVDMARVTPRVAGQSYGVSSIPHLPAANGTFRKPSKVPAVIGVHLDGMEFGVPGFHSDRPRSRRSGRGRDPRPPSAPRPDVGHRVVAQNAGITEDKYDAGALTLDVMMPIYAELEKNKIASDGRAASIAQQLADLQSDNDKLTDRIQVESQTRIRMDAKLLTLTGELKHSKAAEGRAESLSAQLQKELESAHDVISSGQQLLQKGEGHNPCTSVSHRRDGV